MKQRAVQISVPKIILFLFSSAAPLQQYFYDTNAQTWTPLYGAGEMFRFLSRHVYRASSEVI